MSERAPKDKASSRGRRWPRRLAVATLVVVAFGVGIALGQALNDGPPAPATETYVRTLESLPQEPATTGP